MCKENDKFYLMKGEHYLVLKTLDDIESSNFSYSIPLNHGNQSPIFLHVDGDLTYKIVHEKEKPNKKISFKLPPMKKDEKIKIHFCYWVLNKKIDKKDFPSVSLPISEKDLPENVKIWLLPTKSVQSNNMLIKMTAYFWKSFNKDLFAFIKKVMIWDAFRKSFFTFLKRYIAAHPTLNRIFLPDRYWANLEDAVSSLLFGGLCSGQANLAAALLRSMGIPTRVLISDSTFYGKNYWLDSQHYFNEFYCPGYGWISSQSGMLIINQGNNIALRILYPEDEDIAGNGIGGHGGMAPWFWTDNENIVFDKPEGYMEYKLPKSKKIGVPTVISWIDEKIDVPKNISEDILENTSMVWDLFTENVGRCKNGKKEIFDKIISIQKQSIDFFKQMQFEKYLRSMEKIKDLYLKI